MTRLELRGDRPSLGPNPGWGSFVASRKLRNLISLRLRRCGLNSEHFRKLIRSSHLPRLRELDVSGDELLTSWETRELAESPLLGRLTALRLTDNSIGTQGALELAAAPGLVGLTELDLSGKDI